MEKNPGPGSGINVSDPISKSLVNFWGLKILKFFVANPDPEFGDFLTLDPESGMEKFGSGIKIPGPQHCAID
jgi:hypothetical protein